MTGSIAHVFDADNKFTIETIDSLGDAHEALYEFYQVLKKLNSIDQEVVDSVFEELHFMNPMQTP